MREERLLVLLQLDYAVLIVTFFPSHALFWFPYLSYRATQSKNMLMSS